LIYRIFFVPKIDFADWQESPDCKSFYLTRLPFYEYTTILPDLCFKGSLYVPENLDRPDLKLWVKGGGCIEKVEVNDKVAFEHANCSKDIEYDVKQLRLDDSVHPGQNSMFVKILQNGGTIIFEMDNAKTYNLIRFVVMVFLICFAMYLLDKKMIILDVLLFSFVILHIFPEFFLISWGFDFLKNYSIESKLILVLTSFIVLIPKIQKKLIEKIIFSFKLIKSRLKPFRLSKILKFSIISIIFFFLFWFLRTKYSLGDSGFIGNIPTDNRYTFFHTAPLTAFISTQFYNLIKLLRINLSSYDVVALLSCIYGAGFIFSMLLVAYELGNGMKKRIIIFGLVSSAYFIQLFFGYIEFIPSLYFWMSVYLLTSVLYLKNKISPIFPSIALAITISAHLSAPFLFPSLIALYILKTKSSKKSKYIKEFLKIFLPIFVYSVIFFGYLIFIRNACTSGLIACIVNYINILKGTDPSLLMPIKEILSFWRTEQMTNELILVSPGALIAIIFILISKLRKIDLNNITIFLIVSTVFYFIRMVTAQTGLGLPQDWDVISPIGLWLTVLSALLLVETTKNNELNYYAVALIIIPLIIHTGPLILAYHFL
jgi:hypothetical protein